MPTTTVSNRHTFNSEAEVLADTIARDLDLKPPVDVRALVAELAEIRDRSFSTELGLDAVLHGLHDRPRPGRRPVLLLDSNRKLERQRFTLAHEFGHLSMAWHVGRLSCNVDSPFEEDAESVVWLNGTASYGLERDADNFAARILVPRSFVASLDLTDPAKMLRELETAQISAAAGLTALSRQLPPGHVFVIVNSNTRGIFQAVSSPGTFNLGLRRGHRLDEDHLAKFLSASGETLHQDYRVFWGLVEPDMDLTTTSDDWETILLRIIDRFAPGEGRGDATWKSAVGIIGAAHSKIPDAAPGELARRIKQAFTKRADQLNKLITDADFDDFVSARANAFITRPPRKKNKTKPRAG